MPGLTLLTKSDFILAQTSSTKLYYRKGGYPSSWLEEDEYLRLLALRNRSKGGR
jgi:hypothetical protein